MCGIAGIVSFSKCDPVALRSDSERMARSMSHRGPDDWGIALLGRDESNMSGVKVSLTSPDSCETSIQDGDYRVTLANRRLSIIDLSAAGRMPMCNEDRTLWVTHNGEIYNYRELARELVEAGHEFRSATDTEVILHGYEEWGIHAVQRFNGMWAFALWDSIRQRLWLSRDRCGIKPLYYCIRDDQFLFGSEVKSLLAAGVVAKPNLAYLAYFMQSGLMNDGDETFYCGIKQVPAAHSLLIDGSARISRHCYWSYPRPIQTCVSEQEAVARFRELLKDAVRLRLRSDVPVGACLSGGMDSSSIVALYRELSSDTELHTFSVLFDDPDYDEKPQMESVLSTVRTNHHYIHATPDDLIQSLPTIVRHLDGPHLSIPTYPFFLMLKEVGCHLKVLLDGQGGDELLAGYNLFQMGWLESAIKRLIRTGTRDANLRVGILDVLAGRQWPLPYHLGFWAREKSSLFREMQNRLSDHRHIFDVELDGLAIDPDRSYAPGYYDDPLTDLLHQWHSRRVLPGLLQYGDALSMASSVEVRLPFLDYRLVEFVFTLPYYMKHSGLESKSILRRAVKDILPEAIYGSRRKIGFDTPFSKWLRSSLKEPVREILFSKQAKLRDLLDYEILERLFQRHMNGSDDESAYLWRYLLAEVWMENGLRERGPESHTI